MHRQAGGSESSSVHDPHLSLPTRPRDASPLDDVWFEVEARDGSLVGTADRVIRRRRDPAGDVDARAWGYDELRGVQVLDAPDGGAIVIEPLRGSLVPVPIPPDSREEAFQAATVLSLLIARAQRRSAPSWAASSTGRPHRSKSRG